MKIISQEPTENDLYTLTKEQKAAQDLDDSIKNYLAAFYNTTDPEDAQRMASGVKAFIGANMWGQPFIPIEGMAVEESKKHWWEFWKK